MAVGGRAFKRERFFPLFYILDFVRYIVILEAAYL